jgi:hypothetical protein
LRFKAIECDAVQRMFDAAPGKLPWVEAASQAPPGWVCPLDSSRLPELCATTVSTATEEIGKTFSLDLVAATFVLLTRWEEWVNPRLDAFGCQKEDASLAYRQQFLDRPVLDEWALVLLAHLEAARPGWMHGRPAAELEISHDIDVLRYYVGPLRIARGFARKMLKEGAGLRATSAITEGWQAWRDPRLDPCVAAVDQLMNFSEAHGTHSTFFFMAAQPSRYDDGYSVESAPFTWLRDRIQKRGHQMGWHPGFVAAEDDDVFAQEHARILQALQRPEFGARHHFLRWRAGRSWARLAAAGCSFDASMGFNYTLGFRASSAHRYKAYDLKADQPLALQVRPLVAMDGPLQHAQRRDAVPIEASVAKLTRRCATVGGCMSVLVHNYSLMSKPELLDAISIGLKA